MPGKADSRREADLQALLRQQLPEELRQCTAVPAEALRAACEAVVASLVTARLTPDGWIVESDFAVHPWELYAAAMQLADPAEPGAAGLALDAEFMRRGAMLDRRGAGGPRLKLDDAAVFAAVDEWKRKGHKAGRIKWLAGRLGVDEKTISKYLRRLEIR